MSVVPEFSRAMLRGLGAPVGRVECFIEVPFDVNGKKVFPDGLTPVFHEFGLVRVSSA